MAWSLEILTAYLDGKSIKQVDAWGKVRYLIHNNNSSLPFIADSCLTIEEGIHPLKDVFLAQFKKEPIWFRYSNINKWELLDNESTSFCTSTLEYTTDKQRVLSDNSKIDSWIEEETKKRQLRDIYVDDEEEGIDEQSL